MALHLDGAGPLLRVLPAVHFQIIDHYMRRNEGQSRVIGTLLGTVVGQTIEVTNCFPVPHNETDTVGIHVSSVQHSPFSNRSRLLLIWSSISPCLSSISVTMHGKSLLAGLRSSSPHSRVGMPLAAKSLNLPL